MIRDHIQIAPVTNPAEKVSTKIRENFLPTGKVISATD